jgi:curved DNA-binding protein CbpA
MTREDIYQLLGISKKSPARLVKKAFREFAEHNHPDFFPGDKNFGWTVAAVASVDEMLAPVRKLAGFNIMMTLVICVHGSTICLQ